MFHAAPGQLFQAASDSIWKKRLSPFPTDKELAFPVIVSFPVPQQKTKVAEVQQLSLFYLKLAAQKDKLLKLHKCACVCEFFGGVECVKVREHAINDQEASSKRVRV